MAALGQALFQEAQPLHQKGRVTDVYNRQADFALANYLIFLSKLNSNFPNPRGRLNKMELEKGLEPMTCGLQNRCSTN